MNERPARHGVSGGNGDTTGNTEYCQSVSQRYRFPLEITFGTLPRYQHCKHGPYFYNQTVTNSPQSSRIACILSIPHLRYPTSNLSPPIQHPESDTPPKTHHPTSPPPHSTNLPPPRPALSRPPLNPRSTTLSPPHLPNLRHHSGQISKRDTLSTPNLRHHPHQPPNPHPLTLPP